MKRYLIYVDGWSVGTTVNASSEKVALKRAQRIYHNEDEPLKHITVELDKTEAQAYNDYLESRQ